MPCNILDIKSFIISYHHSSECMLADVAAIVVVFL